LRRLPRTLQQTAVDSSSCSRLLFSSDDGLARDQLGSDVFQPGAFRKSCAFRQINHAPAGEIGVLLPESNFEAKKPPKPYTVDFSMFKVTNAPICIGTDGLWQLALNDRMLIGV
jgi:hypothetical protein